MFYGSGRPHLKGSHAHDADGLPRVRAAADTWKDTPQGETLSRLADGVQQSQDRLKRLISELDLRLHVVDRAAGAVAAELSSYVTHTRDLPLYCAHCRDTYRVTAAAGGTVACPGCARDLEVHEHHSPVLGSFLGSASGGEA